MRYLSNVVSLHYVPEKCTGCRRCIEVCPRAVFEMRDKRAYIVDRDLCMECGGCANNCEFEAITVNSGVGCATAVINALIKGKEPECASCESGEAPCC